MASVASIQSAATGAADAEGGDVMAVVDIDIGAGAGTFEAALRDPQGNPAGSASVISAAHD